MADALRDNKRLTEAYRSDVPKVERD